LIELRNVTKSFGPNTILRNISLKIPQGETTAIIGPSGTGKSVTLKHIVGLLRPDEGEVCLTPCPWVPTSAFPWSTMPSICLGMNAGRA
jgi:ABC-type transporter Mla maintaining outer membrane lipid asymmetry ATPase subunit MlaF